jgi:hypothetical protein
MNWIQLTRRTNNPKLTWLRSELAELGIATRINGSSCHAPIMEVQEWNHDAAMDALAVVDDMPDNHMQFVWHPYPVIEPLEGYPYRKGERQ